MNAARPALEDASAVHARALRARLERQLAISLTELLTGAAAALGREPSPLLAELSVRLGPSVHASKLPPWLFSLNAQLQRSMEAQDAEAVELLLADADRLAPRALPASEWQLQWHDESRALELGDLERALQLLRTGAPQLYAELEVLLAQLAICEGRSFNGACDPECFGLVLISRPRPHHHPLAYYLEQLIHCGAQLHWICLEADQALLASSDGALFDSPWNRRPISSHELLFELFWLARAVAAFQDFGELTAEPALLDKAAVLERGYRSVLDLAASQLASKLTTAGRTLLRALAQVA